MGEKDQEIINIDGYKFKRARKDEFKDEDSILCVGNNKSGVCYSFSISVMDKLIKELKESPELQDKFNIKLYGE